MQSACVERQWLGAWLGSNGSPACLQSLCTRSVLGGGGEGDCFAPIPAVWRGK